MNGFRDTDSYDAGQGSDGSDLVSIPLQADEDGMIGRECPDEACEPRYFKMSLVMPDGMRAEVEDASQMTVVCPYCGTKANMQYYHTQRQIEWLKSILLRDSLKAFQGTLEKSMRPMRSPRPKGPFSVSISYKPTPLPSVRHYVEEKLKRVVVCDNCGFRYAVYGISFHCPLCGEGSLIQHLNRSAEIVGVLLEECEALSSTRGPEVGDQVLGNALEDVVGLFEGFLKHIYQYEVKRRLPRDEAEIRIKRNRTSFQRIESAEALFREDVGVELFKDLGEGDRKFLVEQFLKRHVLTHNLGLIDNRYKEKMGSYAREGRELELSSVEVSRALQVVVGVITAAARCLLRPDSQGRDG